MSDALARIEKAVDELKADSKVLAAAVNEFRLLFVKQQSILENHIYRTELLETSVKAVVARIHPLEKSETRWALAAKVLVVVAAAVTGFMTIYKATGH